MVRTLPSNVGGAGSIPGQGVKIPYASKPKNQNIKQKRYCNKFNKDLKMVHVKKKRLKLRERKPLAQGHTDELKSKAGLEYKSLSSETDALDLFRFRFTLFKLNKIRDCFQIGKGVRQGCILLPCLFNLYQSTSCKMPG